MRHLFALLAILALAPVASADWSTNPSGACPTARTCPDAAAVGKTYYHRFTSATDSNAIATEGCGTGKFEMLNPSGTSSGMPQACLPDGTSCKDQLVSDLADGEYLIMDSVPGPALKCKVSYGGGVGLCAFTCGR